LCLRIIVGGCTPSTFSAIATDENLPARRAVQNVAQLRRAVTNPGPFRQKITFQAWEHADFQRQLLEQRPGAMDHYCGGPGYETLYRAVIANINDNNNNNLTVLADTLMLACLLRSGVSDGWVQRTVTPVASSLTRGEQGVVAVHGTLKRVHSALLWLPILSMEERQKQEHAPSTVLPVEMTKYLLATLPPSAIRNYQKHDVDQFVVEWEEFLYKVVTKENKKNPSTWVIWNAACSEAEKKELAVEQKLMAMACQPPAAAEEEEQVGECCSFYDPNLKPFVPRRRRDDNDDR